MPGAKSGESTRENTSRTDPCLGLDKAPRSAGAQMMQRRRTIRIGIPRVLGMYGYAPLFTAYFESLGVPPGNLVFSDFTSDEMFRLGSKRGVDRSLLSVEAGAGTHPQPDLCQAPAEAARLHLSSRCSMSCARRSINMRATNACPTTALTPEVVKAAFTKETDVFADNGILYLNPLLDLSRPQLLARQMFGAWEPILGLSREENARAIRARLRGLNRYEADLRRKGAGNSSTVWKGKADRDRAAGKALPSRSGDQSGNSRGTAEARLSDILSKHAAAGRGPSGAAVRG